MVLYKDIFNSEAAREFIGEIKNLLLTAQRPPEEIILDETDLCNLLHISKRHAADLRKEGILRYSKIGGKLYYLLSDVLEMIRIYRIEIPVNKLKFNI